MMAAGHIVRIFLDSTIPTSVPAPHPLPSRPSPPLPSFPLYGKRYIASLKFFLGGVTDART
jgi:hypothetical protein